jgi:hypothetical protein
MNRAGKSYLLMALIWLFCEFAYAGKSCSEKAVSAEQSRSASAAALAAQKELQGAFVNDSRRDIALIARIGQDLREHGLTYSHVGFVIRRDSGWRVLHLLNQCGSDRGGLFEEGLLNFFLDDMFRYQSKIVWLEPKLNNEIKQVLAADFGRALLQERYSVIAKPFSARRQNSTAWVLEVIAAAEAPGEDNRQAAHAFLKAARYPPDIIRIPYGKRVLGGLFKANADFTDHSVGTRLRGDYPTSTVRSIFRFLRAQGWVADERVIAEVGGRLPHHGD